MTREEIEYQGLRFSKISLDEDGRKLQFEKCLTLESDPELVEKGVTACAITYSYPKDPYRTKALIEFRGPAGNRQIPIPNPIASLPIHEVRELPPEDQFWATHSILEGIVDVGFANAIEHSITDEVAPLLDLPMTRHVANCLAEVLGESPATLFDSIIKKSLAEKSTSYHARKLKSIFGEFELPVELLDCIDLQDASRNASQEVRRLSERIDILKKYGEKFDITTVEDFPDQFEEKIDEVREKISGIQEKRDRLREKRDRLREKRDRLREKKERLREYQSLTEDLQLKYPEAGLEDITEILNEGLSKAKEKKDVADKNYEALCE